MPTRPTRSRPFQAALAAAAITTTALALLAAGARPSDPQPPTQPTPPPQPSPDPAQREKEPEAIVLLRDGQQYTGFMVEQRDADILIRIANIITRIPREDIEAIQILPPVLVRYRQMRDAIDDDDADRIVMLAEWLRARGRDDLALREVEALLERQPIHVEARRLRLLISSQMELAQRTRAQRDAAQRNPAQPAQPPQAQAPDPAARDPRAPRPEPFPLLTPADINLIRVYEVDLNNPPRMLVDRDTIAQLIERHVGDPLMPDTPEGRQRLLQARPEQILDLMFRLQARDFYSKVRVLDHPASIRTFRDQIHRTLIQNACATTNCHGGSEAGRLRFATARPNADATVYTNFLILERFRTNDGQPLIDYDQPARSILLQYALPRQRARTPHPVVPNAQGRGDLWRPFFRGQQDERFVQAINWINSLYRPRPEHPIDYEPPAPFTPPPKPDPAQPPIPR